MYVFVHSVRPASYRRRTSSHRVLLRWPEACVTSSIRSTSPWFRSPLIIGLKVTWPSCLITPSKWISRTVHFSLWMSWWPALAPRHMWHMRSARHAYTRWHSSRTPCTSCVSSVPRKLKPGPTSTCWDPAQTHTPQRVPCIQTHMHPACPHMRPAYLATQLEPGPAPAMSPVFLSPHSSLIFVNLEEATFAC